MLGALLPFHRLPDAITKKGIWYVKNLFQLTPYVLFNQCRENVGQK